MKPIRDLSRDEFVARFGGVYESSPQFAETVWDEGGAQRDSYDLYQAFRDAVDSAGENAQIALLRAHPDLADRVSMSAESTNEQAGAGLDQCTMAEVAEFQQLNDDYKRKFGFPFIIAVRGLDRDRILGAFRHRLNLSREAEFAMALHQIHRIAALRLQDLIEAHDE
ncbi:2-oxo-4-hydroxy-4-carboxy--5-ureidoimidazoline (OHCU) decarboxylase [alpha proteobacterium U9-1i]|nr:2-oxo-4-hydroxy-4-carboxy--5-ureidoimidazoline (OHCU) decarboxylase [alpha proteobacterium U9-1i]